MIALVDNMHMKKKDIACLQETKSREWKNKKLEKEEYKLLDSGLGLEIRRK